jgi:hypothetical protein
VFVRDGFVVRLLGIPTPAPASARPARPPGRRTVQHRIVVRLGGRKRPR